MQIAATVLWMPKTGNAMHEYEDAFYPTPGEMSGKKLRFAIADGASEGMLSQHWAYIITRTFCRNDPAEYRFTQWLETCYDEWQGWYKQYMARRARTNPVQWYEEPGLEKGAFSTLLGLRLIERGSWTAHAIGDSCLFQIRNGEMLTAFPLENPADFDNSPFLVASNPKYNQSLRDKLRAIRGDWQPGDQFLLMTDALAQWFLNMESESPWETLAELTGETFPGWLRDRQAAHALRNDDVTLLRITIQEAI